MDVRGPSRIRGTSKKIERFGSHDEAMRWSFGSLTRWWITSLPIWLLGIAVHFAVGFLLDDTPLDMRLLALPTLVLPVAIWLFVAPIVYLCIVLAGGVKNREERSRR